MLVSLLIVGRMVVVVVIAVVVVSVVAVAVRLLFPRLSVVDSDRGMDSGVIKRGTLLPFGR